VTRGRIPTLLGDLRRVAEQLTRLLGDLGQLVKGLEQGSCPPAFTAVLHDLRRVVDQLARLPGDVTRLLDGLEEGDLLERAHAIVGPQDEDGNREDRKEGQLLIEDQNLSDLRRLVKTIEEVTMPVEQQDEDNNQGHQWDVRGSASGPSPADKKIGDVNDLIIKTDGQIEGAVAGWGDEKTAALKLARFKVTPEPGGTRV
jgi:hypothetical protein